jgi:surface polysaccharide O-acyltransferase-like enzyme
MESLASVGIPAQHSQAADFVPARTGPRPRQWELDALRVLAIAGVVAIHVIGMLVDNDDWRGTARWWAAVAIDLGFLWTVPVFVMISGALVLAPRAHAAGPAEFLRRRFTRILPAMVVWHLVYLVGVRILLRSEHPSAKTILAMLIDAKVYTALYFLWLIAGLYAIAPVLAAFLRDGGRRRAMFAAGAALSWTLMVYVLRGMSTLLGTPRPISVGAWTQWCSFVGYFLAGWALHRLVLSRRATLAAALMAVVLMAEVVWQYGHRAELTTLSLLLPSSTVGAGTAVASLCLFVVAVHIGARVTPGPRLATALKRLSDASFGVFLVHLLLFEILRQGVPAVERGTSFWVLLGAWALVLTSSFAVSIGAARVPYVRAVF